MLNVNVGLLGHVDSGKTALAKALSRTASTAAFDKSPQSQSRGITLDLGFSACEISRDDTDNADARRVLAEAELDKVQCTLVDCPGHASLIRTVVGGAQIIDAMVLVVDATKGVQAQTAECLVLGEVLAKPLVVALNKVDAVQGSTAEAKATALAAMRRKLRQTFRRTRWPAVSIVEVAAAPRDGEVSSSSSSGNNGGLGAPRNVDAILPQVLRAVNLRALKAKKAQEGERPEHFYMLVDHCFAVRGQGTVFTGTVVAGMVRVGDTILVPELQATRKVKGLQVFHKPVEAARSGDRVGLCVAQFDPSSMERGVLCSTAGSERTLVSTAQLIARVHKVRYHPFPCDTHTKFHITIGHATVMGTMRYFARPHTEAPQFNTAADTSNLTTTASACSAFAPVVRDAFDPMIESAWVEELGEDAVAHYAPASTSIQYSGSKRNDDGNAVETDAGRPLPLAPPDLDYYAVLLLERPVLAAAGNSMVAMRLDVERENFCRIALAGTICYAFTADNALISTTGNKNNNSNNAGNHHSGTHTTASAAAAAATITAPVSSVGGLLQDGETATAWRRLPVVRYRARTLRVDRVLDTRSCIADGVVSLDHGSSGPTKSAQPAGKAEKAAPEARQKSELFGEVQKFIRLKVVFEAERNTADEAAKNGDAGEGQQESDAAAAVAQATAAGSVTGVIDSTFGKTGKVKLVFAAPVFVDPTSAAAKGSAGAKRKKKTSGEGGDKEETSAGDVFQRPGRILLILKKYPFALHSGLDQ